MQQQLSIEPRYFYAQYIKACLVTSKFSCKINIMSGNISSSCNNYRLYTSIQFGYHCSILLNGFRPCATTKNTSTKFNDYPVFHELFTHAVSSSLLIPQIGSPSTLPIVDVTAFLLSAVVYILSISRNPVIELITGISEIGVSYAHSLSTKIMELISSLEGVSGIEGAMDASTKTVFSFTPATSQIRSLNSSSVLTLILLYNLSRLCKNFS